jgi:hypothetical protein
VVIFQTPRIALSLESVAFSSVSSASVLGSGADIIRFQWAFAAINSSVVYLLFCMEPTTTTRYIYIAHKGDNMEKTNMRVSNENLDRLAKFGDARTSLDDCLGRVLDLAEAMRDGGA